MNFTSSSKLLISFSPKSIYLSGPTRVAFYNIYNN